MAGNTSDVEMQVRRLIAQLADFSMRGRARTQLVMMGKAAVGPLTEALRSPIEGVAWAAAKTLGEIGDATAVPALKEALSNPALQDVAADAIRRIAAREPGPAGQGTLAASTAGMKDEELAKALLSDTIAVEKGRAGYSLTVKLPGGRKQRVEMTLTLKDIDGSPLVALYTECGVADAGRYEWALKTNLRIPFGAFALRETAQGAKFVMVDAYLREAASIHQLQRSIEMLAKRADALEASISGADNA